MSGIGMNRSGIGRSQMGRNGMDNNRMNNNRMDSGRMDNSRMDRNSMGVSNMDREEMARRQLMGDIQETGFVLVDLNLFLDSHPQNQMALDYFRDAQKHYDEIRAEYESKYGPLTAFNTNTEQGWSWIQAPWPWELEG